MLDVSNSLKFIGRIVGEATPTEFLFVSSKDNYPPKYEYVIVRSRENIDGEIKEVNVLAQVVGLVTRSTSYNEELDLEALERIYNAGIDDTNVICEARTLGFMIERNNRKEILMPRRAVYPGNEVYIAPDTIVKEFFSYPEEEGLYIGNLISRSSVPVYISVNGFKRHLAILAQTGAGKSYTVGVLIEEILTKGGTIIVLDPHADYVFLSRKSDGSYWELCDRVKIFRNPNSTGRYDKEQLDNVIDYTISFSDLSEDEIASILELPERWTNIRGAIRKALEQLKNKGSYNVKDLIDILKKNADKDDNSAKALKHINKLLKIKVFGDITTPIDNFLNPMQVSIVDLSGLNDASMDYIAYRILTEVYQKVSSSEFEYPVFVIIEEAHKFIPKKTMKRMSREIINTIAAEGRKFGIFMTLVSQRPSKIDSDALSQCNSQIILRVSNPIDQKAIIESSERLSESLLRDLPGLNIGEAVIVGEITKVPVMVKVRERITQEGGADIDIVEKLRLARENLSIDKSLNEFKKNNTNTNTFMSEV